MVKFMTSIESLVCKLLTILQYLKEDTSKDGKAGLQSNFQTLNAKVNQYVDMTDRQTDRWTPSIHVPKLLCNPTKNGPG